MKPLEPRLLHSSDPIANFDCGIESLNVWLAEQALKNQNRGDSRTYVCVDSEDNAILGYYSLASWAVKREQTGGWLARNAPNPVSVILLGRLAVSVKAQGTGLGLDLLTHAVRNATLAANLVGARAIVAEAINQNAISFYQRHGFKSAKHRPDLLFLPLHPNNQ